MGLLAAARHLVVFTGAGVSRESGIPTFRDAEGMWAKLDPLVYATPQGFRREPELVWSWYQWRRRKMGEVAPNPAHYAIAELERLIPRVTVVTQNIDGLHQRAGSSDVLELHGSIVRFKCFAGCRGDPTPVPPPLLESDELAHCPHCGALVRPDVVWFNERLPAAVWEMAAGVAVTCDAMLIVGTSGVVEPAASLPKYAAHQGAFLVEVNPEETPLTAIADVTLYGRAGEVLPRLVERIRALKS